MIDCAAPNKNKTPERVAQTQELLFLTHKLENREEKRREQNKKRSQKENMKRSLKYFTGSFEDIEDALDRLMT